ncbi:hypothetical protein [Kribbella sp. C-35]|uniref:hypothetical protein n=1 Tax=Kribbella sp. C-35 TaxID=2789276 RepID=UPI00397DFD79
MTNPATETSGIRGVHLSSLYLWSCSVERMDAARIDRGAVTGSLSLTPEVSDESLTYQIAATYKFMNSDEGEMATIVATYVAEYYGKSVPKLTNEQLERFSKSVILHVTPFLREFIATMMNRLGLPDFYLPLMRRSELEIERAPS